MLKALQKYKPEQTCFSTSDGAPLSADEFLARIDAGIDAGYTPVRKGDVIGWQRTGDEPV
jgi:hypothetical protein